MRTLTLARMGRALMIAAAMIMLPQLASAQLPVATKKLTLQDSDASAGVSIQAAEVTTGYTLTMPATLPALAGALLYTSTTDGGLSWTDPTGIGNGYYPRWDAGTSTIVWTNPSGADNPNWSLTGNALTSDGFRVLGFPAGSADISIETNGARRIGITDGGAIDLTGTVGITGATTIVGATDINTAGGAATTIGTSASGTVTVQGATLTTSGSLGHTGTSSLTGAVTVTGDVAITGATTQTGAFSLVGATSDLNLGTDPGAAGDVLVSKGDDLLPAWESITDAVGIRARKRVAIGDNATSVVVAETALAATDIITFSIEGADAAIFGVITSRTAGTGFTVTLSGAFSEASANSGFLNYIVMTP